MAADYLGKVLAVSDGDTFTMEADGAKVRVRICGIDAPERGQAGYGQAAGVLSSMIEGKTVHGLQVGEGTVCDGRSRPTSRDRIVAQCFLDKGVPEAAIRWYQKALKLPALDQETRTALHYELASSYESAQDRTNALQHFMEVYGSNIDYRDVGERIKALKS